MKRTLAFALVCLLLLGSLFADGFEITKARIAIKVEESSRMHISETYDVHFTQDSHGIYRNVRYAFDNPDGNEFNPVKAYVENVETNIQSKTTKEDGTLKIKIGDSKVLADPYTTYVINYDYGLRKDYTEGYDELYYDIVSPEWDAPMKDVEWTLEMPKAMGKYSITVLTGKEGSVSKSFYTVSQDSRTISGNATLGEKEGITVRILLPEGYWTGLKGNDKNEKNYLTGASLLALIALAFTAVIWFIYGNDQPLDDEKRKNPPEGLTPMDVGYILDEGISMEREISAMIFLWAEEGFLAIDEKPAGKKDEYDYTFRKLKDLPEDRNREEKELFALLFQKDEETSETLATRNFSGDAIAKLLPMLSKDFSKGERAMKDKKSLVWRTVLWVFWGVLSAVLGIISSLKYPGLLSLVLSITNLLLYLAFFLISGLWTSQGHIWSKKAKGWTRFLSAVVLLGILIAGYFIFREAKFELFHSALAMCTMVFSISIGVSIASFTDRRNAYGDRILGEAVGFRKFINDTPASKVQDIQENDPEFFRRTYPYAFAMGLGEKWGKKFSSENIAGCSWYNGERNTNNFLFYYLLFHSHNTNYTRSQMSHMASSGGGVHVGGGFSGGGGRW